MRENETGAEGVDCAVRVHRADLVVNDKVIIELKPIEVIAPVQKKQLLTYLRLSGLKLGYLLNFGEELMKNGITRIVNGLPEASPFPSSPSVSSPSASPRLCESPASVYPRENPVSFLS